MEDGEGDRERPRIAATCRTGKRSPLASGDGPPKPPAAAADPNLDALGPDTSKGPPPGAKLADAKKEPDLYPDLRRREI